VLAEKAQSENPYFTTGAGGVLQTLLYGFGGLEITDHGLVQSSSQLPAAWTSMKLTGIGPRGVEYTVK
jgi:protein-glucosylgalactosylhydroxylysine glucosidase